MKKRVRIPLSDGFSTTFFTKEGAPTISVYLQLKFDNGVPQRFFELGGVLRKANWDIRHTFGPRLQALAGPNSLFRRRSDQEHTDSYYGDRNYGCRASLVLDAGSAWVDEVILKRQLAEIHEAYVEAPLSIVYSGFMNKGRKDSALSELEELLDLLLAVPDVERVDIRKMIRRLAHEAKYGPIDDSTYENLEALWRIQR